MEVRRYLTTAGRNVFSEWLAELADRSAKARIADRIDRLSQGNPGDCKMLGGGLFELRINWGPGYRVYFKQTDKAVVLLLCGGDKSTQARDIKRAKEIAAEL